MRGNPWTSRPRRSEPRTLARQSRISLAAERARLLAAAGKRDYVEDLAIKSDAGLAELSQRRTWLRAAFVLGLIATAIVWITALRFPHIFSLIYSNGVNSGLPGSFDTLLTIVLMSIPFAPPFVAVFALSHLMFPSPAPVEIATGLMSTFEYRQKSNRRTLIIIAAGMAGALNCLLLLILVTTVTGH
jgi:hypothetical protein